MQKAHCFHIGTEFLLRAACAQIIICDAEVYQICLTYCNFFLRGIFFSLLFAALLSLDLLFRRIIFCSIHRLQQKVPLSPCFIDLFRVHHMAGERIYFLVKGNLIFCRHALQHVSDKLHLFRGKFRVQKR